MLDDKLNQAKEFINANKKNIIIGIVLLVVCVICWDVFSPVVPNGGTTAGEVTNNIQSTRNELTGAGQAVENSQRITSEIRRTNQNIEQSNKSIRQSIESSQSINKSSHDLIREGQQILSNLPRTDEK
jgi:predicted negative regulator of RcsB-dependent stress response